MDALKAKILSARLRAQLLELRSTPAQARAMRRIALSHPELADLIRAELWTIQRARKRVRMLLARHRNEIRRTAVIPIR